MGSVAPPAAAVEWPTARRQTTWQTTWGQDRAVATRWRRAPSAARLEAVPLARVRVRRLGAGDRGTARLALARQDRLTRVAAARADSGRSVPAGRRRSGVLKLFGRLVPRTAVGDCPAGGCQWGARGGGPSSKEFAPVPGELPVSSVPDGYRPPGVQLHPVVAALRGTRLYPHGFVGAIGLRPAHCVCELS